MYRTLNNTGFTEGANFMFLFELTTLCQFKYIFLGPQFNTLCSHHNKRLKWIILKKELEVRVANNKIIYKLLSAYGKNIK